MSIATTTLTIKTLTLSKTLILLSLLSLRREILLMILSIRMMKSYIKYSTRIINRKLNYIVSMIKIFIILTKSIMLSYYFLFIPFRKSILSSRGLSSFLLSKSQQNPRILSILILLMIFFKKSNKYSQS